MIFSLDYTEKPDTQMTIDMSSPTSEPKPHRDTHEGAGRSSSGIRGAILGALFTVLLFGAIAWFSTGLGLLHLLGIFGGGRTHLNVDQPTVVHQIQQLQRLETVSYTMDKIISGEHANAYLPKFLAGDRLLLVVHGEVIGGIDLANLQAGDVQVQGQKVTIHLPAAELFSTRIDNARTKVYSRDTGLFSSLILTSKAKSARKQSANYSKPRCRTASSRPRRTMRGARYQGCCRALVFTK